jgi:hypothetical protein
MRHPYAVTGIAFAVIGSIQMMAVVMVANFVKAMMAFNAMAGAFFQAFAEASDESKSSGSDAQVEDTQTPQDGPPAPTPTNSKFGTPSAHGERLRARRPATGQGGRREGRSAPLDPVTATDWKDVGKPAVTQTGPTPKDHP